MIIISDDIYITQLTAGVVGISIQLKELYKEFDHDNSNTILAEEIAYMIELQEEYSARIGEIIQNIKRCN